MDCLGYCVVGGALLGSMLLILVGKGGTEDIAFKGSLTEEQLAKYKLVYKQRLIVYLIGIGIGVVLAAAYAAAMYYTRRPVNACIVLALVLGVATLYYIAVPKKTILADLTSETQLQLYSNLSRAYSLRSVLGMIIGILGTLIIGWGLSK